MAVKSRKDTTPVAHYIDSCAILSMIDGIKDRVATIVALIGEAERGEILLYTSVLSHAEVAFATQEKTAGKLDDSVEEKIDGLWHPSSPIKSHDVDRVIAREARALNRLLLDRGEPVQGGADSIHLATALRVGALFFHTYDKKILRLKSVNGMRITLPKSGSLEFPE